MKKVYLKIGENDALAVFRSKLRYDKKKIVWQDEQTGQAYYDYYFASLEIFQQDGDVYRKIVIPASFVKLPETIAIPESIVDFVD